MHRMGIKMRSTYAISSVSRGGEVLRARVQNTEYVPLGDIERVTVTGRCVFFVLVSPRPAWTNRSSSRS